MNVIIKMERALINDAKLNAAKKRMKRRSLFKIGALIKTTARRSMKRAKWKTFKPDAKRKGKNKSGNQYYYHDFAFKYVLISNPKKPPRNHTEGSEFSLKNIEFAVINDFNAVIVGPLGKPGGFADMIEKGGTVKTRGVVTTYERGRKVTTRKTITKRIRKRPFMRPAAKTVEKQYAKIWKGAFK